MENIQQGKNSVTEIKNHTGCFIDKHTGKYFFTMPIIAMSPTDMSKNQNEKLALFLPAGNTCQAVVANTEHLTNASVDMYLAMLACDSQDIRNDLLNNMAKNDFFNNRSIDDALSMRAIGEFWAMFGRLLMPYNPMDQAYLFARLNFLKLLSTRAGLTDQIRLLSPNSTVNTIVDLSMNGFRDHDVWNVSTDDFENKFNNSMTNVAPGNYQEYLFVRSFMYYQNWYINNFGKLNTCFGDTSVESLRYVLLKQTDHYALSSNGSVYDFGFLAKNKKDKINQFKELFLLVSCNKVDVNGKEVNLNDIDLSQLNDNHPIKLRVNGLINGLRNILNSYSKDGRDYIGLYTNYNIQYDVSTKRFAFIDKGIDAGDATGWVYTMLMDIIASQCPPNYQLRYDFFISTNQIQDWVSNNVPRINSLNNRFSFSCHLTMNRQMNPIFYTSLYQHVKQNKDGGQILKFIDNTFKFFDEYSIPPNIKQKLAFNEEETKKCEESAKQNNYLAYFFKAEYLQKIENIIQKKNDHYGDIKQENNVWLKNYHQALENFLNQYNISDVLTENGKKFFDKLKKRKCWNDNEKKTTINKFRVINDISCNFNKQINAIDFSLFYALLEVKNVNSGSRSDILISKMELCANYFFRNNNNDPFRTFTGKIGKLTKDAFLEKYFQYVCKNQIINLISPIQSLAGKLLVTSDENRGGIFDQLMNSITKFDFREYMRKYFSNLKECKISTTALDGISIQDLIQILDSNDQEVGELVKQCQEIIDDAYKLKTSLQTEFNNKQYKKIGESLKNLHQQRLKTFKKYTDDIKKELSGKNDFKKNKRIFFNCDFNAIIDDEFEKVLREYDENLIKELINSACAKVSISNKDEIENMIKACIKRINEHSRFDTKKDFIEVFGMILQQDNGVGSFEKELHSLKANYKDIIDIIAQNPNKKKMVSQDIIDDRSKEEFKDIYLAWQFIQWMVYLVEIAVYYEYKNNPIKLAQFKNNKHNLECHLRNGNFNRIVLNKDLAATDNLIRYLLKNCITEQNKIKSITERIKLDLVNILDLTSASDFSSQYNLLLMNKENRKIKDGIFSNDTKTTTNALYFPVQSIANVTNKCNLNIINSYLSSNAQGNIGDINQAESTLWLDENKYKILDIDEFFWECTKRGEFLKTAIANGRWIDIKFGLTLTKERKEQATSKGNNPPTKPLTFQERSASFDEFASLLRYNPLELVSGSLQSDKSNSFIFKLIDNARANDFNERRLGNFFDLIENVFLKKYKCMDITSAKNILNNASFLDEYNQQYNRNVHSNNSNNKENSMMVVLRKNDSSTSFELRDGGNFKLSIDFIINLVKHVWVPDIQQGQQVLKNLFEEINNFALVFCKDRETKDKEKRKRLILLLYTLHSISTDISKQKPDLKVVGDYENDDMKIQFCQETVAFNQFLQNYGFNNLLEFTQQFKVEVQEEQKQKQKDAEIQKDLEKLKQKQEEKNKKIEEENSQKRKEQEVVQENKENEVKKEPEQRQEEAKQPNQKTVIQETENNKNKKNEFLDKKELEFDIPQSNQAQEHEEKIPGVNNKSQIAEQKEIPEKLKEKDNQEEKKLEQEVVRGKGENGEQNQNQGELIQEVEDNKKYEVERKESSEEPNNDKSVLKNPKKRQIAEGVILALFVVLSIVSRFVFPIWALYIFIACTLISSGLLIVDMWVSHKKCEEKNVIAIGPQEYKKIDEIGNESKETEEINNQNNEKHEPKTEINDEQNQGQMDLNNRHNDEEK